MRPSASTIIASVAATLLWVGCLAVAAKATQPGECQVPDNLASDVAVPQQEPSAIVREHQALFTAIDRFVNPGESDPHWSFTADALALQRTDTRKQPLALDTNGDALLDAGHLDPSAAMGFQLSAIRHGPCGWDLELGYFQIDGWIANAFVAGQSFMVTDAAGSGFNVVGPLARYWSGLHMAEINVRHQWLDGLTLLAGFRTGELDEAYDASGTDITSLQPDVLNAKTFNHLYGFQVGADWECYNMGGPLRISALCKSGIYDNSASQRCRQIDTGSLLNQSVEASRNQATFMGEAGAVATYDVTCHLSLRAFFQTIWIEGVALAPEQIGATDFLSNTATIDTHGGIFYYGGGLGMELKF